MGIKRKVGCEISVKYLKNIYTKYHNFLFVLGISIGCWDTYSTGLDCQWVDVTNLPTNRTYILRVAINPNYMIGEASFENNGAECLLHYTGERSSTRVTNCNSTPLWYNK